MTSLLLTRAELDVLSLLAEGLTAGQVAERRVVSVHTVQMQVRSIRTKLGARTATHAVALAYRQGILPTA